METLELVLDETLLTHECECWAGDHGAEMRVVLVCCNREANGCEHHYNLWRNAWERIAEVTGRILCKSCDAEFASVSEAIRVHPI